MVGKGHGMNQISEIYYSLSSFLFFGNIFGSSVVWWLAGVWHFDQKLLHEGDAV